MAVAATVSVEDYLHTSFPDLDREYREGELVERSLPDYSHGRTQGRLVAFFFALPENLSVFPCVETRMRISARRFLVPDVAVFHPVEPSDVPETPPLIAVEVLSPGDRLSEVREKLEEYRAWGVPHVWLVDPHSRRFYTCDAGLAAVSAFHVPELETTLLPAEIFG